MHYEKYAILQKCSGQIGLNFWIVKNWNFLFYFLATLIITILEVNTKNPEFGPPWRPDYPYIDIIVQEEQGEGSYVTTLIATDSDAIHEYRLLTNPQDHFTINPQTGMYYGAVKML